MSENQNGKPLKLKCVLFTEDGIEWLVIRQFYATDLITNKLLEDQFAGMHLKKIDKKNEQASGNKPTT